MQVAAPQIAVQARRRLGRAHQLVQPIPNSRSKPRRIARRGRPVAGGAPKLRLQPPRRDRTPPTAAVGRPVRLRQPADEVVVVEAEAGRAVARCSAASPRPSSSSNVGRRLAGERTPAPGTAAVSGRHSHDLGDAQRARLGRARPRPRASAGEHRPRGGARFVFTNSRAPVGQRDGIGAVDVAAGSGRAARTAAPSAAVERRLQLRRPSRRPAHDAEFAAQLGEQTLGTRASQMSNTSSNPPAPP